MHDVGDEDKLLKEMLEFLTVDFVDAVRMLDQNDTQYLRRSFIRAIFAAIESVIFAMRTEIMIRKNKAFPAFSIGELAILEEKSFILDKSGKIVEAPKFIELKKNILFVFKAYGKSYGTDLNLFAERSEWNDFVELIKVRNRITHPKSSNDIVVKDIEIKNAKQVIDWFMKQLINAIEITTKALNTRIDVLEKSIK